MFWTLGDLRPAGPVAVNNKQPVCVGLFLALKMTSGFILGGMIRVTVGGRFPVCSPLHKVPVGGSWTFYAVATFYSISVDLDDTRRVKQVLPTSFSVCA